MNAKLTYESIIKHALNRSPEPKSGHYHHIIPRCVGGSDDYSNLVKLTYREHYFCHYLLTKLYPNSTGIWAAYRLMSDSKFYGKPISTRHYEFAKMKENELMYEIKKVRQINLNKDQDIKTKQNRTKSLLRLWKYFADQNILNPTESELLLIYNEGCLGLYKDTIHRWFDSLDQFISQFNSYIKLYPIKFQEKNKITQDDDWIINKTKSRIINACYKNLILQRYGNVRNNDDVTEEMLIKASWYNPKRRCWNHQKWELYFSESEWIHSMKLKLEEYPIDKFINRQSAANLNLD